MLRTKKRTPTLSPFIVFTFELEVESIKELGGALEGLPFCVGTRAIGRKKIGFKELEHVVVVNAIRSGE
jgi:hypothetical protein